MSLARQLHEIALTRRAVTKAERRRKQCDRDGHVWDDSVPSPPGKRYCARCRERHPA